MMPGNVLGWVFALGWVPFFLFRAESQSQALPAYAGAERLWVRLTPVLFATHVTGACWAISRLQVVPLLPAVLGLGVFAAAMAFWFWGRILIGPLRVRRMPDEPPLQFHRDGAFGVVRHPLYFGYLGAAAAPLCVAPRGFVLVTFALCVVALAVRAVQEESRLRAQLGVAYEAYARDVKRLIPFVW